MFKRLFSNKRNKTETLSDAVKVLIEHIEEEETPKKISQSLETCLDFLKEGTAEDIERTKEAIFQLTQSETVSLTSRSFSVYASLLERVHITGDDVKKAIDLYAIHLTEAVPFFILLSEEVKKAEEGEGYYSVDIEEIYKQLLSDRQLISESTAKSTLLIDALVQNLMNILSCEQAYINLAKGILRNDILQIKEYNQGAYWMDRLFDVLFDEPIVVIDVDNHIGLEGNMSGIGDNSQLHLLLMGLSELNETLAINDQALAVAQGMGIQSSNIVVEYKWNMYTYGITEQEGWEEIKIGPAKTLELQDFWIAGEGTPQEIPSHNGKRIILLGRTPIKRASRLQRTFKNMRANIEVEKVLNEEEVSKWLKMV